MYDTEINDVVVLHYSRDLGRGYGVLPVLNNKRLTLRSHEAKTLEKSLFFDSLN